MGLPGKLNQAQPHTLEQLTQDLPVINRTMTVGKDGYCELDFPMQSNDVVLVKLAAMSQLDK